MISTFTSIATDNPFDRYLHGLGIAPTIAAFKEKWKQNDFGPYEHHQDRCEEYLNVEQIKLCRLFLDQLWKRKATEICSENPIHEIKVRFSDKHAAIKLLGTSAVESLQQYHGHSSCIVLRFTRSPSPGAIGWHFDGGNAHQTVQLALNDSDEYEGGRLCYFTLENGVEMLNSRCAGDITKHDRNALHAVTKLTTGTRYSLFVVDKANGLGYGDDIISPSVALVEEMLRNIHSEVIMG